jgi:hypothetical protein
MACSVGIEQSSCPIATLYGIGLNWYNKGEVEMTDVSMIEGLLSSIESQLITIANKQDETNKLLSSILSNVGRIGLNVHDDSTLQDIHRILRNQFE